MMVGRRRGIVLHMDELWRDIEADLDAQVEDEGLDQDTVDETVDETVDQDDPRFKRRRLMIELAAAAGTLVLGLFVVHVLVPAAGAIVILMLVLAAFAAWAALIAGVDFVAGLVIGAGEMTGGAALATSRFVKRSRPALGVAAGLLAWGVVWHAALSPAARTRRIVNDVVRAVEACRAGGATLPTSDIEAALDVGGADPFGLARFTSDGRLLDAWGRALVYRRGEGGRYQLYSVGVNGKDDLGARDDYGHADAMTDASPPSHRAGSRMRKAIEDGG
jgi:hypothetical protein